MNPSPEAFASANGLALCYDTFGSPADPPMILVMGLGSQMILWHDAFCAMLASQGRYVVRFDNRDIGRSTHLDALPVPNLWRGLLAQALRRPVRAPYALLDMARDTVGLMDALGFARVDLVGASLGGAVAQEIAIHFPERLRTLTAIMTTTGDPRLPRPTFAASRTLMKKAPRKRDAYLAYYLTLWSVLSGSGHPIDPVLTVREGALGFERGIYPAGAGRQLAAMMASGNRKAGLRLLRVPTLVLHGASDPLIRPAHGHDLQATIPGAKLEMIPRMGHTFPEQCWQQITMAIDAHIARATS